MSIPVANAPPTIMPQRPLFIPAKTRRNRQPNRNLLTPVYSPGVYPFRPMPRGIAQEPVYSSPPIPVVAVPNAEAAIMPVRRRPLARTRSMIFSGSATIEDIRPRVQAFIDNFFMPDSITVDELLGQYKYYENNANAPAKLPLLSMLNPLPVSERYKKRGALSLEGTYGTLFLSSEPDKVIKILRYDGPGQVLDIHNIIAELLIQYIIQTDLGTEGEYGMQMCPEIYGIYRHSAMNVVWVVMEKLEKTLTAKLRESLPVTWPAFKQPILQLVRILRFLNRRYGFVHRDLKGNNIMMDGVYVKLIDFGFSAMNFSAADGSTIRISSSAYFDVASPCRARQDMASIFIYFRDMDNPRINEPIILSEDVRRFIRHILPDRVRNHTWSESYNRTGNLLSCPTTNILDPDRVLTELSTFSGGRRGTRRRRRHRR